MIKNIKTQILIALYKIRTSALIKNLIIHFYEFFYRNEKILDNEQLNKITSHVSTYGYYSCPIDELINADDKESLLNSAEKKIDELNKERISYEKNDMGNKNYVARFSTFKDIAQIDDPLISISVNGLFRQIAESYFQTLVRITNLDYWINFHVPENSEPFASQKWHRDYEDEKVLKVFFYINDVTNDNGPFFYVSESNKGSKYNKYFPAKPPYGVIVEDDEINNNIEAENILKFTPKSGSILIVDTAGLHKGGLCLSGDRKLFTATYTSLAGISKRNYKFNKNTLKDLSPNAMTGLFN